MMCVFSMAATEEAGLDYSEGKKVFKPSRQIFSAAQWHSPLSELSKHKLKPARSLYRPSSPHQLFCRFTEKRSLVFTFDSFLRATKLPLWNKAADFSCLPKGKSGKKDIKVWFGPVNPPQRACRATADWARSCEGSSLICCWANNLLWQLDF